MKSIMQNSQQCYICGSRTNLERHHVMHGTANRIISDKYGLTVYLCMEHHRTGKESVHNNREIDLALIRDGQRVFEKKYSHARWMIEFGKNYLEE